MHVGNRILKIIFVILFIITLSEVVYYIYFKFNINNTLKQSQPNISTDKIIVSKSIASKNNNKIRTISNTKCPKGFILVPGDKFYDTKDFCVMKYEAKCDINGDGIGDSIATPSSKTKTWNNLKSPCKLIVSSTEGWPITNISLDNQVAGPDKSKEINIENSARKYCGSKGWHVFNNNEYMSITKNITEVELNWCDKSDPNKCGLEKGAGIISSGHSNEEPNNALEASIDDSIACYLTGKDPEDDCQSRGSQKRTFTLTNGEVIWDIAGNVWEMIDIVAKVQNQPSAKNASGERIGWGWSEFDPTNNENDWYLFDYGSFKPTDFIPPGVKWNSSHGIGKMSHNSRPNVTGSVILIKGGSWEKVSNAGIFTTAFLMGPYDNSREINDVTGFRCVSQPL